MKKLLFLTLLPIFIFACGDKRTGFDMSYRVDFEIPAGLPTFDTHVFETYNIPTNKSTFLTANSLDEQDITRITPREARLSINFSEEDFYFVQEIVIEMFTIDDVTGKEVFFRDVIPLNTGNDIAIIPSLPEVTDILLGDRFSIRTEMRLRDISPSFVEARLEMIFFAEYEQ